MPSKTVLGAKEHHFIEPRNIVLSGNEKIDRAMLRLERKRIATEKEERALLAAVELTREITGGIVKGAFDTLANGFTAVGQIGRGVAENPDPIAQGVALGGVVGSLLWLGVILESNQYTKPIGDFLQFDKLINGLKTLPGVAATVVDTIGKQEAQLAGRDDKLGTFAIGKGSLNNGVFTWDLPSVRYYTNMGAAAAAYLILRVADPGNWQAGRRYWTDNDGYLIDAPTVNYSSVLLLVNELPPARRGSFYSDDQLRGQYPTEYTIVLTVITGGQRVVYAHSTDRSFLQRAFDAVNSYNPPTVKDAFLYNPLKP